MVKKLWEYIHHHNLQDPKDKRQIVFDTALQTIFKKPKSNMFQMMKLLSAHVYRPDTAPSSSSSRKHDNNSDNDSEDEEEEEEEE